MPQWHGDLHKRKRTGGRRRPYRGKRAYEMGGEPAETKVGPPKILKNWIRGGGFKLRVLAVDYANVTDPTSRKSQKTEILRVVKNPANVDYERRGIVTKGAIIETPLGIAKVTSRPGQNGIINAVLIREVGAAG